jgi:hypothetical protein
MREETRTEVDNGKNLRSRELLTRDTVKMTAFWDFYQSAKLHGVTTWKLFLYLDAPHDDNLKFQKQDPLEWNMLSCG